MGPMTYTMIKTGDKGIGGMQKVPQAGMPSSWLSYVEVDDIKASTAKAKSLGANVMLDVTEVMNAGFISVITDPTGAAIGLWQPKAK